jgi:plasmid maintenance system antidote protein VapI
MNKILKAKIFEKYGTQGDFAQAVKVDETLVSKIVRGRRNLDPEKQSIWAKALGCHPRDIFANESPISK